MDLTHAGAGIGAKRITRSFQPQVRKHTPLSVVARHSEQFAQYAKWCGCALALLAPGSFFVLVPAWLIRSWRANRASSRRAPGQKGAAI